LPVPTRYSQAAGITSTSTITAAGKKGDPHAPDEASIRLLTDAAVAYERLDEDGIKLIGDNDAQKRALLRRNTDTLQAQNWAEEHCD
jgi:hypothetical protein